MARRIHQPETLAGNRLRKVQDALNGTGSALEDAPKALFFDRGEASGHVPGCRIASGDGRANGVSGFFDIRDDFDDPAGHFLIAGSSREDVFGAHHLRRFREADGSAKVDEDVGAHANHRVRCHARRRVRTTTFGRHDEFADWKLLALSFGDCICQCTGKRGPLSDGFHRPAARFDRHRRDWPTGSSQKRLMGNMAVTAIIRLVHEKDRSDVRCRGRADQDTVGHRLVLLATYAVIQVRDSYRARDAGCDPLGN